MIVNLLSDIVTAIQWTKFQNWIKAKRAKHIPPNLEVILTSIFTEKTRPAVQYLQQHNTGKIHAITQYERVCVCVRVCRSRIENLSVG